MKLDELLRNILFCFLDFDGNLAQTFRPSPGNINVTKAYSRALTAIFGTDLFSKDPLSLIGGLQNRAPIEIIAELFACAHKAKSSNLVMTRLKQAFLAQQELFDGQVPPGKGVQLIWDEENNNWDPIKLAAEMLTRAKLMILLAEISPNWPLPCQGVKEFFTAWLTVKAPTEVKLQPAILSAGHDKFIQQTFAVWGISCPEVMVTDDDVRGLPYQLVKPDPALIDLVLLRWLQKQTAEIETMDLKAFYQKARLQTIYFGDDPHKDGQLAKNAGLLFAWYNPEQKQADNLGPHFSFTDWRQVPEILGLT